MFDYQPKLTIVGAGPGEIDLITVKGVKALNSASVVLYESEVSELLVLEYAPAAIRVFVGERRNYGVFSQEDINELIVEYAETYGHVVRLKGGNLAGLGADSPEINYATSRGLQVEYIPGVPDWPEYRSLSFLQAQAFSSKNAKLN